MTDAQQPEKPKREQLQELLLESSLALAQSLDDAEDAPFKERAEAVAKLIDKLVKLGENTTPSTPQEQVIRFEYQHPDGKTYPFPSWAGHDSAGETDTVSRRGVWSPFWKDGDR